MAVENKVGKRIEEISGSIITEVIRYRDNRMRDLEELGKAMLQSEKNVIKDRLDVDTNQIRENISELLSESESLVESYGYGNENSIQSFGHRANNYEWSSPMVQVYEKLQKEVEEVWYQPTFKEPNRQLNFEFVVMDTIANTDYPEKNNDLRVLSMMSTPNTSIARTIENEGWPAIDAGMNLKAAKYIPDPEKSVLSRQWLLDEKNVLESQKDEGTMSFKPETQTIDSDSSKKQETLKSVDDHSDLGSEESIQQTIKAFHAREVLILENKIYYGSLEEESAYKQHLREEIKEQYQVGKVTDLTNMADMVLIRDKSDYCELTHREAIQLLNEEQHIYDFNLNTKQWTPVQNIEMIALSSQDHAFYIERDDLSAFLQQQFDTVMEENRLLTKNLGEEDLVDYRVEIDPEVGSRESINSLGTKKQPTAASVQEELEEDIEYGIGEVGDSNQEAIEEAMIEEITIEEDFER